MSVIVSSNIKAQLIKRCNCLNTNFANCTESATIALSIGGGMDRLASLLANVSIAVAQSPVQSDSPKWLSGGIEWRRSNN